jgi:hypothetical protein
MWDLASAGLRDEIRLKSCKQMPRLNAELAEVAEKFLVNPALRSLRFLRSRDFFTGSKAGSHTDVHDVGSRFSGIA